MKVIQFSSEKHYAEICHWWNAYEWPQVPLDHLPDTGFVVETDELEVPLAAAFLYFTGTAFAIFEWAVVNPSAPRELRKESLETLLDFMHNMARKAGVKTIFTSAESKNRPWISRLERNGFTVSDSNMINLTARVGG